MTPDDQAKAMVRAVEAIIDDDPRDDGTIGIIVRQALRDDPQATAEEIAEIIREARADAASEQS